MTVHPLVSTWVKLMALTLVAGASARVTGQEMPGLAGLLLLMVVTVAKSRLILSRYLRLDQAPQFRAGLTAAVAIIMAIVTGSFLVPLRPAGAVGHEKGPVRALTLRAVQHQR